MTAVEELRRSVKALALELPESVWGDVNAKVEAVLKEYEQFDASANLMLDALLLIRDEAGTNWSEDPLVGPKDHGWCAGVAMSAIAMLAERAAAWKQEHEPRRSTVPRFLPRWLGGEADRVDGDGVRLRREGTS